MDKTEKEAAITIFGGAIAFTALAVLGGWLMFGLDGAWRHRAQGFVAGCVAFLAFAIWMAGEKG